MADIIAELASLTATGAEGEIIYGIFNDPVHMEPLFANGMIHPNLRQPILDDPLWSTPSAPAAKRFMLHTNEERVREGKTEMYGNTILRERTLSPWRDIKGAELEAIDEGRRPNNR